MHVESRSRNLEPQQGLRGKVAETSPCHAKGDKRYVRRKKGKFSARQSKVGRSLASDRRSKAKTFVKKGEGDRGDRRSD
jgi:hypothetical protein